MSIGQNTAINRLLRISVVVLVTLIVLASGFITMKIGDASRGSLEPLDLEEGWSIGNPQAPITIVEFSDLQCPFCEQVQQTLSELLKDYPDDIRIIFRHFPLPQHPLAQLAAEATEAAGDQGKFWEMLEKIFEKEGELTITDFGEYAGELGLDVARFNLALENSQFQDQVLEDVQVGKSLGVHAVPTLFLNGRELDVPYSYEEIMLNIEMELAKQ